ncbi:MAG: Gfo/Idh/MocA family oxidoreductase [Verrucomicrobia bacterium]|nr:Gfo/Idh/MocA family oxidoreductase [Verrucomicrobiota bacterium]
MGIKEVLGFGSDKKIRYAIVGAGDIAQEDMMPSVKHTGNSIMTALVTSDPKKAKELGAKYDVEANFTYEEFPNAIASGVFDAIYVAVPNWRHAEFVIPALRAGIHVLCEKPMEVSTRKCQEILDVAKTSSAKLMIAYRLHFEPGTLSTIDLVRSGKLGEVHTFASTFAQQLSTSNHRAHSGDNAGPVLDMGPYPVNAARYIFSDEPTEVVSAVGSRHPEAGFDQGFDDSIAVTLRFPGNRLAQFNLSYYGGPVNNFVALGSKGSVMLDPAYMFGQPVEQTVSEGQNKTKKSFKNTDHFGGEMKYFSNCILNDTEPEPDGEEGFADVRVLEGVLEALKSAAPIKLPSFSRTKRINTEQQKMELRAVSTPDLINTSNPAKGVEKQAKN